MNIAVLILRLSVAILMLTHGFPKLEKIIAGNFAFSDPIGLGSTLSLILTVFAEFLCSILIAIGLGTRFATLPLLFTMFVILFIVHGDKPVMDHYNVVLYLISYMILLITGSGKFSADYLLQHRNS